MAARFDAVIVGGGPSGALVALGLARRGWHVALIERRPPHTGKTCGHCLNPRGWAMLDRAGLAELIRPQMHGSASRVAISLNSCTSIHRLENGRGRSPAPAMSIVDRAQFDQALINRARETGVQIFQPAAAAVFQHIGHQWELTVR